MGSSVPDRVRARALIDPADRPALRALLARYGLRASASRGQRFLASPSVLDAIVEAAELSPEDHVVEIGPGLGALTVRLSSRAESLPQPRTRCSGVPNRYATAASSEGSAASCAGERTRTSTSFDTGT